MQSEDGSTCPSNLPKQEHWDANLYCCLENGRLLATKNLKGVRVGDSGDDDDDDQSRTRLLKKEICMNAGPGDSCPPGFHYVFISGNCCSNA